VFDHIAFRAFLEQPARKNARPFFVLGRLHVELHECSGFLDILPRRRGFAGTQPHNRRSDAQRLARLHLQVARLTIPLV